MNETLVTIVGNVASDVRDAQTDNGTRVASFRLASTSRRFDRGRGGWVDGETVYLSVTCWRRLAENVVASVGRGDPLVVTGRLRIREYGDPDSRSLSVEVDATAVGHDLSRGTSAFRRTPRGDRSARSDRDAVEALVRGLVAETHDEPAGAGEAPGGRLDPPAAGGEAA